MRLCVFAILVGLIASVEARSYTLAKKGHECNGAEKYVGRLSSESECAAKCQGVANMFLYGTNEFGVNRCDNKGCDCYCEYATTAECKKTVYTDGYNLYALDRKGMRFVKEASECNGAERRMGYRSRNSCAEKCIEAGAGMIIYGTRRHGDFTRCRGNQDCSCYCEDAADAICFKTVIHNGFNLYRFDNPIRLPRLPSQDYARSYWR